MTSQLLQTKGRWFLVTVMSLAPADSPDSWKTGGCFSGHEGGGWAPEGHQLFTGPNPAPCPPGPHPPPGPPRQKHIYLGFSSSLRPCRAFEKLNRSSPPLQSLISPSSSPRIKLCWRAGSRSRSSLPLGQHVSLHRHELLSDDAQQAKISLRRRFVFSHQGCDLSLCGKQFVSPGPRALFGSETACSCQGPGSKWEFAIDWVFYVKLSQTISFPDDKIQHVLKCIAE